MITIIDYKMGNLKSILNMLSVLNIPASISSNLNEIRNAEKLILPGVGSFDQGIINLKDLGIKDVLDEIILDHKKPILGICLGMQLFSRNSEEGTLPGLGWIDAETVKFGKDEWDFSRYKVPHMGWNTVSSKNASFITNSVEEDRFYFVHSFHVQCNKSENIICTTDYSIPFHSIIQKENIIGVQFHPEKSHKYGMKILNNFAKGSIQ
jgi:glutamine amidotransferase